MPVFGVLSGLARPLRPARRLFVCAFAAWLWVLIIAAIANQMLGLSLPYPVWVVVGYGMPVAALAGILFSFSVAFDPVDGTLRFASTAQVWIAALVILNLAGLLIGVVVFAATHRL